MSSLTRQILKPTDFSSFNRSEVRKKMSEEIFDLVIVGGGINGAGVARDAVSRGMKVALVEARDFAEGTSSRSSKLIHGGVRYLENFEFHLVFEALSERGLLFEIAPHLVHPLQFLIPVYKDSRVGLGMMDLGLWIYDALALFDAPEAHRRWSLDELKVTQPLLGQDLLTGALSYADAFTDDDRLVIETLRSAHRSGALSLNYVEAKNIQTNEGEFSSLECYDHLLKEDFQIRGRHLVSAVGPWVDLFGSEKLPNWRPSLRPSKGVHLVFSKERFPIRSAIVMGAEKRIVFAIPRNEMVIVGTTDTDYPGDPANVQTTAEDVTYLLQVANRYFPEARLSVSDILSSYSGVRPLVDDGSATESKTSREHRIWTRPERVTFVAGGKYTTYRRMAKEVVDECLSYFRVEDRLKFGRSQTVEALNPLVTADSYRDTQRSLSKNLFVQSLQLRHGSEANEILKDWKSWSGEEALTHESQLWQAEALHSLLRTQCQNPIDFLTRRSPLFLSRPDQGLSFLEPIAKVFDVKAEELVSLKKRLNELVQNEMGWRSELNAEKKAK